MLDGLPDFGLLLQRNSARIQIPPSCCNKN